MNMKNNRILIVDGYNLIYNYPGVGKLFERDREEARNKMAESLKVYSEYKKADVVIVYDGDQRDEFSVRDEGCLQVRFSRFPEKADVLIRKLADQWRESADISVVTSDSEIMSWCRARRIHAIPSQRFSDDVSRCLTPAVVKKYDHKMEPAELKEWMRLFGEGRGVEEERL
jgi:predicted RNA-binding protein with PIN domain